MGREREKEREREREDDYCCGPHQVLKRKKAVFFPVFLFFVVFFFLFSAPLASFLKTVMGEGAVSPWGPKGAAPYFRSDICTPIYHWDTRPQHHPSIYTSVSRSTRTPYHGCTLYTKPQKIQPARRLKSGLHHGVSTLVWRVSVTLTTIYLWGTCIHACMHVYMYRCIHMYILFWKIGGALAGFFSWRAG